MRAKRERLLRLVVWFSRRRGELLDQLPDLCRRCGVRVELQVGLVRRDRGGRVARGLGGLRELELRVGIVRLELRELLVRVDRALVREQRLLVEVVRRGARLRRGRLLDRIRAERLAELARRLERRARRRELLVLIRERVLVLELLRLRELQPGERRPRRGVLLLDRRQLLERVDGAGGVALRLVRRRELPVRLRVVRMLLDVLLRGRDRRAVLLEDVEVAEQLVEAAVRARADAEEREGDGEDDGEHDVHRLRAPAHPDEEELLVRVAAGGVLAAAPGPRLRRSLSLLLLLLRLDRCARHFRPQSSGRQAFPEARRHGARTRSPARSMPRRGARGAELPERS